MACADRKLSFGSSDLSAFKSPAEKEKESLLLRKLSKVLRALPKVGVCRDEISFSVIPADNEVSFSAAESEGSLFSGELKEGAEF